MKSLKSLTLKAIVLSLSVCSCQTLAQSIPPDLVGKAQSLSNSEKVALAKEYGVELPTVVTEVEVDSRLAEPGQRLTQATEEKPSVVSGDSTESAGRNSVGDSPEIFGRNIFDQAVSTFAPTDNAPVPDNYRLGVGDELLIQLFGKDNSSYRVSVGRDGAIRLPKLGAINLTGLLFDKAVSLIETKLNQQLIGVDAVITMGKLRSINIFMAGEVNVPGSYSVSAFTTISQALFQAGGVSEIGSMRSIEVLRNGQIVGVFDTYDLLLRGDSSGDMKLKSGDVVFVSPVKKLAELRGEVKRPMVYELSADETISDLINFAAGIKVSGYPEMATLISSTNIGVVPTVETIDVSDPVIGARQLKDGDKLFIPTVGAAVAGSVSITGAVYRAGILGWTPGMRVSDIIGSAERDLFPNVDLNYALIISTSSSGSRRTIQKFRLRDVLSSPRTELDPKVQVGDEIAIFTNASQAGPHSREIMLPPLLDKISAQASPTQPLRVVTVEGAVKSPGKYPLLDSYTAEQLIRDAGGFDDSAFATAAELRRVNVSERGAVEYSYRTVTFDGEGRPNKTESLRSRDVLVVKKLGNWQSEDSVEVFGELFFPGPYRFTHGDRLSDLVKRAGGLTESADPIGAVLLRKSIADLESEQLANLSKQIKRSAATKLLTDEVQQQTLTEIDEIGSILGATAGQGRLLIDLRLALTEDPQFNLELEPGDRLYIPRLSNVVAIVGEVNRPSSHSFNAQLSTADYLDLAAGVTKRADEDSIYIVGRDGSVRFLDKSSNFWSFSDDTSALQRGDTIVVPINSTYKDSLTAWSQVTQLIYQSMVSVAAIAAL